MFKTALAAAFACLCLPAFAAECEFPYEKIFGEFATAGAPLSIIPTGKLGPLVEVLELETGKDIGEVSRGFLVIVGGNILLALEVDACLIPPINLGPATPLVDQLSGQDKSGRIGA